MGCVNSTHSHHHEEEYVETLTLKRKVTKKVKGKSLKISISVIADPLSSNDDLTLNNDLCEGHHGHELCEYHVESGGPEFDPSRVLSKQRSFRTISVFGGKRLTKFPKSRTYKICYDCKENKDDVHKTMHQSMDMDLCRKCSVKSRKAVKKKAGKHNEKDKGEEVPPPKINIAAFASLLALTALDLTAPASDAILKNRKNTWIQLAGHPGGFAPAGPNTIWKKRYTKDNNETKAYEDLMDDTAHTIVPMFYREVEYNSEYFIEMEDLLQHFHDPNIMDIKMGTRTFLESEVKNTALRRDLYDKMVALDPSAPTEEEHSNKSITKLRYMQFRERESSTSEYGFRIEAVRMMGQPPTTNLKKVKSKDQIVSVLSKYVIGHPTVRDSLLRRLEEIKTTVEESSFFRSHEIIGSSILVMYDKQEKCGVWLIDFSKTCPVPEDHEINHRLPWELGNHEDGLLFGLDNFIQCLKELPSTKEENSDSAYSSHSTADSS